MCQVTCPCGHRFSWPTARPLIRCRHPHTRESWWGSTCEYCSTAARTRLAIRRTGISLAAAPVVAAGGGLVACAVAGAASLGVATAAAFGPLAVVYEPARRLLGSKHENPFVGPAMSGAFVSYGVARVLFDGYESD